MASTTWAQQDSEELGKWIKDRTLLSLRQVVLHSAGEQVSSISAAKPSRIASAEVDAVIPNTPEGELMVERMNVQIAAWCH
jgi:hypothetical protein